MKKQYYGFLMFLILSGTVLAVGSGGAPWGFSQDERKGWELLVKYENEKKAVVRSRIALRPNVSQKVSLYVRTSDQVFKNLKVRLVRLYGEDDEEVQGEGTVQRIGPNVAELVSFEAAPKDKTPLEIPREGRAQGSPFNYLLRLQVNDKVIKQFPLLVMILHPHEYMDVDPLLFDKKTNHVSIALKVKPGYDAGAVCPVNLIFEPEMKTEGDQRVVKLTSKDPRGELYANFPPGISAPAGRVYLTVDGFERAFMFKASFLDKSNWPELRDVIRVRLKTDRYFNPDAEIVPAKGEPKTPPKLKIRLEADGIADPGTQLEVAFDRDRDEGYAARQLFQGLRDETMACAAAPKGMLQFKSSVRDWTWELDLGGTSGRRQVRVRVLDKANNPLDLADEENANEEPFRLFQRDEQQLQFAPLKFRKVNKAVYAEITVDSTKPEGLKFDEPERASVGEEVLLKAWLKNRTEEQAPITKVEFFLGDPQKEKESIAGTKERRDSKRELWQAPVTVPKDAKDKLEVWVKATTATQLWATDKTTIFLREKKAGAASVKGVVKYDSRPQAGVRVVLVNEKTKAILGEKKTDDKGKYTFTEVSPGSYRVGAHEGTFNRKGQTLVTVPAGSSDAVTANVDIQ